MRSITFSSVIVSSTILLARASPICRDSFTNCADFGPETGRDECWKTGSVFYQACPATCRRCPDSEPLPPRPCVDSITNCETAWKKYCYLDTRQGEQARSLCLATCNVPCGEDGLPSEEFVAPEKIPDDYCEDGFDANTCAIYAPESNIRDNCWDPTSQIYAGCPRTCRRCESSPPLGPKPCLDVYSNCAALKPFCAAEGPQGDNLRSGCKKTCDSCEGATAAPTVATDAPTVATDAPTVATDAPTVATDAPTEATDAPTEATDAPTEATDAPTEATDAPTVATDAPTVATDAPTVATDAPTVATDAPTMATEAPTMGTDAPTMATDAPTMATDAPTMATDAPTEATNPPTDDDCEDLFLNCNSFGPDSGFSFCWEENSRIYQNCPVTCRRCANSPPLPPRPCLDAYTNCPTYWKKFCYSDTETGVTARSKCLDTCSIPCDATGAPIDTTFVQPERIPDDFCEDSMDICSMMDPSTGDRDDCWNADSQAHKRCLRTCRRCESSEPLGPKPCIDRLSNCADLVDHCTAETRFGRRVRNRCKKTCGLSCDEDTRVIF